MIQEQINHVGETKPKGRVALLIDGENISADFAGQLIMKSLALGTLVVKRVYGNAAKMPKWDSAPGIKLVHSGTGKNATDLLLAIDAVALSHEASVDTFVIASSDRDFTHLAHYLRERAFCIVGMGETKAHEAFRKACTKFHELAPPDQRKEETPRADISPSVKSNLDTLDQNLAVLIKTEGANEGYLISSLGGRMHTKHKTKISEQPERTWRAYLLARPKLYDCDPKGPTARVRLKTP